MYERLDFMKHVAFEAGKIIMSYWGTDVRSRLKKDESVVTIADLKVKEYILRTIPKKDPESGLLTEESKDSKERLRKMGIYIIDELDGSGDFKRKEEDFCFLIAYTENGVPTIGVVYEPLKKRMFYAQKGSGACLQQDKDITRLEPLKPVRWKKSIVGHPKNYKGDKYTKLYELLGISENRLMRSGSMGTRMMQVALQQTHMILGYTKSLKEWDIAAGHAVLGERGISVTDVSGSQLKYNKEVPRTHNGILVVHPDIKEETLKRISGCFDKLEM